MEALLKMKNKEFVLACIELMRRNDNVTTLQWTQLTSKNFCKNNFDMNYPILKEVNLIGSIDEKMFNDAKGNRRYYPDAMKIGDKRYIACNDWYYGENRDTRTKFIHWVMSQLR